MPPQDIGYYVGDSVTKLDINALFGWKQGTQQKFQLSSLAMYGDPEDPRFSYVAHAPRLRAWFPEFDIKTETDLRVRASSHKLGRYYPTIVTATGSMDPSRAFQARLAAVFEKFPADQAPAWTLVGPTDYDSFVSGLPAGFLYVSVDAYTTVDSSGEKHRRYVGLAYPQRWGSYTPWSVQKLADISLPSLLGVELSSQHKGIAKGWARAEAAVPVLWRTHNGDPWGSDNEALVLYRKDVYEPWGDLEADEFTGGVRVAGPLRLGQIEAVRQYFAGLGYWPHRVGGNGAGSDPYLCCTFAPYGKRQPKVRYFVSVDALDPDKPNRIQPKVMGGKLGKGASVAAWQPPPFPGAPWVRARQRDSTERGAGGRGLGGSVVESLLDGPAILIQGGGSGGGGFNPGESALGVPTEQQLSDAVDKQLFAEMDWRGGRQGQLVITVNGKAKLGRAATYAEQGYPCTTIDQKFVTASVGKWLTAMGVVAHFTNPELPLEAMAQQLRDTRLPDVLGFGDPDAPFVAKSVDVSGAGINGTQAFLNTSLDDLLRHRSGWIDEYVYSFPGYAREQFNKPFCEPGDMRRFLLETPQNFYAFQPGSAEGIKYSNYHTIALAEILSGKSGGFSPASFGAYGQHMREYWGLPIDMVRPMPRDKKEAFDRGIVPLHSATPGANEVAPGVWEPDLYFGDEAEWWLGTAWCMSIPTLARILDGHIDDPPPPVRQLLHSKQVALLASATADNLEQGLAVRSALKTFPGSAPYRRLFHNGAFNGGTAIAAHYRKAGPGFGPDHMTVALATEGSSAAFYEGSTDFFAEKALAFLRFGYWPEERNLYEQWFPA